MRRPGGFTLVEILVAVLIAAILSVMAFEAMQQALSNRERIRDSAQRLQAVQFTLRSLVQDLSQLAPRPVREPLGGEFQSALLGETGNSSVVTFTRAGWMNPAGVERSTLQRVRYALRDGTLYRSYWTVLDAQLDPLPVERALVDGVRGFRVRYMNDGRSWQESWPPAPQGPARGERELRWRPIGVEVTLELDDLGKLRRVIEVAG